MLNCYRQECSRARWEWSDNHPVSLVLVQLYSRTIVPAYCLQRTKRYDTTHGRTTMVRLCLRTKFSMLSTAVPTSSVLQYRTAVLELVLARP